MLTTGLLVDAAVNDTVGTPAIQGLVTQQAATRPSAAEESSSRSPTPSQSYSSTRCTAVSGRGCSHATSWGLDTMSRLPERGLNEEGMFLMAEQVRGEYGAQRYAAGLANAEADKDAWPSVVRANALKAEADEALDVATRTVAQLENLMGRERTQAEREAKRLWGEAMLAQVAWGNASIAVGAEEFDRVLAHTLEVDDHIDLEQFRQVADHPPFDSKFQAPIPQPGPLQAQAEPVFEPPTKPAGLAGVFGQRKYQERWAASRADFERRWMAWQADTAQLPTRQLEELQAHQVAESERKINLERDRVQYDRECEQRQRAVDQRNAELDDLIARYGRGEASAVQEYCSIVFEGSVYPEEFEPNAAFDYGQEHRELAVALELPAPEMIPAQRAFKYVKARDEIDETTLPVKDQRERYTNLICSIVLRTMHELWEADRAGHIDYMSVVAGVDHVDSATGLETRTPLIAVAVRREDFEELNLARVTPGETLKHFTAVLSKNAHALTPISVPDGVRG